MKVLKWISKTLGKRKWMIALLSVLQSVLAVSGIIFALLMRQVIDRAVDGHRAGFMQAITMLAVLIFGQIAIRWILRFVEDDTKAVIDNRLRQKVFGEVLRTDYGKIKEYHTGELLNRITSDTFIVTDGAVSLLPSVCSMGVRIFGVLLVMGMIQPSIALFFLIGGCFVATFSLLPRKLQKKVHKEVQAADGTVKSFIQESLESLLVIQAFGCEDKIESTSAGQMGEHRKIRRKRSHVMNFLGTGLRFCIQCGYLFGLCWCGFGILNGNITYGTLTAVIQLIGQIQTPFVNAGSTFPKYTSMLASAERLMELTESSKKQMQAEQKWTREEFYQSLESIDFEHVSFSYDADTPVLKDDSFSVKKGEFAALIGSSGIGKSTVMKLLLSVYEPNAGEIRATMKDGTVRLSELPSGVFAYVPQGNYLMGGPIWQVVGFAEQSDVVDRDKVVKACEIACAHEFICELPNGYDTVLGERGTGLSEGQMQRLAVARAVYSGCPILLLDEATSALDAETERRMILSLKEMSDCTVFLVTHRKDVWQLCDRVLKRTE